MEFPTCGPGSNHGAGSAAPAALPAELVAAIGALSESSTTKPIADLLQSIMASVGIQAKPQKDEAGPATPPTHSLQVKASLNAQRKCVEKLHKIEKQQRARKQRIESLQVQLDAVNVEYARGKEDLEVAKTESEAAQEAHRLLLESSNVPAESDDFSMSDSEELGEGAHEFLDDPAVQAGKRSYLRALTEAKKRKAAEAEAEARQASDEATDRNPILAGATQQESPATAHAAECAAAVAHLAGASGGTRTVEALAAVAKIAEGLSKIAPKAMAALASAKACQARPGPYGKPCS